MDLAGVAALLGVAVAALAALLPLRDRGALSRLERIDKLVRGTDLDDEHAALLSSVRDQLVRRVFLAETFPGQGAFAWFTVFLTAGSSLWSAYSTVRAYIDGLVWFAVIDGVSFALVFSAFIFSVTRRTRSVRRQERRLPAVLEEARRDRHSRDSDTPEW